MQNQTQRGEVITVVAAAAIASGDIVKVGDLIGVAVISAAIGEECEVALKGVYEVPKAATVAISQGAKAYLVAADGTITNTDNSGANAFAGYAFKAAAGADTTVQVLLAQ